MDKEACRIITEVSSALDAQSHLLGSLFDSLGQLSGSQLIGMSAILALLAERLTEQVSRATWEESNK